MAHRTRKVRTREHVLADLAVNHAERQLLLCGCSVHRVQSDYGYDLIMSSYKTAGETEGGVAFFQIKATDKLRLLADQQTISWTISRRDLRLWLSEAYPVILVLYDGEHDRAFWLHVQAFFSERPTAELFLAKETINVRLSTTRRFARRAGRRIIEMKNNEERCPRKCYWRLTSCPAAASLSQS